MFFVSNPELKHFTLKITLHQVWEACALPNPPAEEVLSVLNIYGAHVSEAAGPAGHDSTGIKLLRTLPELLLLSQLSQHFASKMGAVCVGGVNYLHVQM